MKSVDQKKPQESESSKPKETEEINDKDKKPTRERKFFKNRTKPRPVNFQYELHANEIEPDTVDPPNTFKMPALPGPIKTAVCPNTGTSSASLPDSEPEFFIPVTERLSDAQSNDAELADDVTYYLDGVKTGQGIYYFLGSYYIFYRVVEKGLYL